MNEPARLGKYEIVGTLGKGAMGVVYKAFDPLIERTVAIKTIRKDLTDENPDGLSARFRNEARAAGRLNHPGIVQVYEYGEDESVAYIAMEYVEGFALRDYLLNRTLFPPQDVVSVMGQLLEALDYAHRNGVIHRDVKPANIILMDSGRLKIADFGIARIDATELTVAGSVIGTPIYMSPEQFMGSTMDGRADVFSAGVVFYELVSGAKPFSGPPESVAYRICYEPHQPPSAHCPGIPEAVDRLVDRALAKAPADRFQSAEAFRAAIEEVYQTGPQAAISEQTIRTITVARPPRQDHGSHHGATHSTGGSGTGPPTGWDEGTLRTVERQLAEFVGPLAKVLVKKAAHRTTNLDDLFHVLANYVQSPAERTSFLATCARTALTLTAQATLASGTRAAATSSVAHGQLPVADEDIDAAAELLAPYLGPIARVLAKKTARKARGVQAFYAQLADELNAEDRARFLAAAGYPQA